MIAAGLSRQREIVIGRLQRMGARLVDAKSSLQEAEDLGLALIDAYLDVKRRELI